MFFVNSFLYFIISVDYINDHCLLVTYELVDICPLFVIPDDDTP